MALTQARLRRRLVRERTNVVLKRADVEKLLETSTMTTLRERQVFLEPGGTVEEIDVRFSRPARLPG